MDIKNIDIKKSLNISGFVISGLVLGTLTISPIQQYRLSTVKEIKVENKVNLLDGEFNEAENSITIYEKEPSYILNEEFKQNIRDANEKGIYIKYFTNNFEALNPETKKELTDLVEDGKIDLYKCKQTLKYNSVFQGDGERKFSEYDTIFIRDGEEIHLLGSENKRIEFSQTAGHLYLEALMKRTEPIPLNQFPN